MSTARKKSDDDEMLEEYDFSGAVRGKYAKRYAEGTQVVILDPDVAQLFPDSASVNRALRAIAEIAPIAPKKKTKSKRAR